MMDHVLETTGAPDRRSCYCHGGGSLIRRAHRGHRNTPEGPGTQSTWLRVQAQVRQVL